MLIDVSGKIDKTPWIEADVTNGEETHTIVFSLFDLERCGELFNQRQEGAIGYSKYIDKHMEIFGIPTHWTLNELQKEQIFLGMDKLAEEKLKEQPSFSKVVEEAEKNRESRRAAERKVRRVIKREA